MSAPRRPRQMDAIDSLFTRGQYQLAKAQLLRLLTGPSPHVDVIAMMACVLERLGEREQAEHYFRRVIESTPDDPRAWHNLGHVLVTLGRPGEAEPALMRALAGMPHEAQTWYTLAQAARGAHGPHRAARVLREGLASCGENASLLTELAYAVHATGRVEEALPTVLRAVELDPFNPAPHDALCTIVNYAPGVPQQQQFEVHARFGGVLRRLLGPALPPSPRTPEPSGRLRVGLLSPDLRDHAVADFIRGFVEHADRAHVEIACYNVAPREDAMSNVLKRSSDSWRHVPGLSPQALAEHIRKDGVDILVDLAGHTTGHRLVTLAQRPARLQAAYLGYPNTWGLDCMDLRITDEVADPPATARWNTESLAYLDGPAWCYTPHDDAPPLVTPPPREGVTFACFGSPLKYTRGLFEAWVRPLAATPGSRLLLRHNGLAEPELREDVLQSLVRLGADPARLSVEPPVPTARESLAQYERVDISLDTFPYTGTTTICESLLMGVPMVSLRTDTPAGRVSTSILGAVGLSDLVADDPAGYVAIANALANNAHRRRAMRAELRHRLLASALGDGRRFARTFVDVLRREWSRRVGDASRPDRS